MANLVKLSDESDALYNRLIHAASPSPDGEKRTEGYKRLFFQSDFEDFTSDTAKSLNQILVLVQELTDHALLRTSKLSGQLCWSTRPQDAAKAILSLTGDERMLYTYVEDARETGIWIKDLKRRSNLPPGLVPKALERLEKSHLIRSIKNVRHPAQKTYMLYHLAPSDDVTGGSFFDAGDLDESLVEELSNLIVFHVRMQSWADTKSKRVKRECSPIVIFDNEDEASTQPKTTKKRKQRTNDDIEDTASKRRSRRDDPETDAPVKQLAYPAYSHSYPTASQIHAFITTTDAIRATKAQQLTVGEIQGVINVLVWDEKLEKIGDGYRTVRGVRFKPPGFSPEDEDEVEGNGLTQAPCGRCPVFDLCQEGAPVNPTNCVYFKEWLRIDE